MIIPKPMVVTGDIKPEMNRILDFYRGIKDYHPKAIPERLTILG